MSMKSDTKTPTDLQSQLLTQDLLSRSSSQPIFLSSVEVVGGDTFSREFFGRILRPLVDESDYTLGRLLENVDSSRDKLVKSNVFKSVAVSLQSDYLALVPKDIVNYNNEKPIYAKVLFDVIPNNINAADFFLNYNTDEDLSVTLNYLNNNLNENGELVNVGANYNPYPPNLHLITNASLTSSLADPSFKFAVDLFNTHQNNQSWQHASENTGGGLIGLRYTSPSDAFTSLVGALIAKRNIRDVNDDALQDVKNCQGDFLKTSIVSQLQYSKISFLNNYTKNFPVSGFDVAASAELASNQEQSIPDQKTFAKISVASRFIASYFNNALTTQVSADFGGIFTQTAGVHVSDRFYLGGRQSFRGFSKNAVDPNGGNQFYKLGITLYSRLPKFLHSTKAPLQEDGLPIEDHSNHDEANPLRLYASSALASVSNNILQEDNAVASAGLGLKYVNHWASLDLGYWFAGRLGNGGRSGVHDGFSLAVSLGSSNRK